MVRRWRLRWRSRQEEAPRAMFIGLGTIGLLAVRMALERQDVEVVAAVDTDSQKVGKDVGLLAGGRPAHVLVTPSLEEALGKGQPTVALVATTSRLGEVLPTLETLVGAGVHVVASTEELFCPWLVGEEGVERLHRQAMERGVAVVGVGVNPGFVMDRLPAFLAQVCTHPQRVVVRRIVDVAKRRPQLQRKMGVGMTREEYEAELAESRLGHVGLPQSLAFLAASLGMKLSHITETTTPILGEDGRVRGTEQVASGWEGQWERLRLELRMAMGEPSPCDEVEMEAEPSLRLVIPGGVAGDEATAAVMVNTATWVAALPPGVHSGAGWFPPSSLLPEATPEGAET